MTLLACSAKYIFSSLFKQIIDQIESLEEASKHMEVAMKLFKTYEETADADPSMMTDQYLDPLHLMLEMPDMSRLEKPAKPPMPSLVRINYKFQIKLVFIYHTRAIKGQLISKGNFSVSNSPKKRT